MAEGGTFDRVKKMGISPQKATKAIGELMKRNIVKRQKMGK